MDREPNIYIKRPVGLTLTQRATATVDESSIRTSSLVPAIGETASGNLHSPSRGDPVPVREKKTSLH